MGRPDDLQLAVRRPRLLDLFCGAGGAAKGYSDAGFDLVGVDIKPQPHYPFEFHQGDGMTYPLAGFDAIHASPPCQRFTTLRVMGNAGAHGDLLTPTLERLDQWAGLYVVENVMGAPMRSAVRLCGTVFGLGCDLAGGGRADLHRHRLFEVNWPLMVPPCAHKRGRTVIGFYGDHARLARRYVSGSDIVGVAERARVVREALGIDWMTWPEATQAIPPAYTQYIGERLILKVLAREPVG